VKILYHHRIRSKDGQFVHLDEMVKALRSLGHTVLLVGPKIIETGDFGGDGGIVDTLKRSLPKWMYELVEFSYSFFDYFRLMRAIRRFKPDVIYERYNLFFMSGIWAKKRTKLPLLLEVNAPIHDERKEHDGLSLNKLAAWSEASCWRDCSEALCVTEVLADIVRSKVPESSVTVVPNAINYDSFKDIPDSRTARTELDISHDSIVIGFVGFIRDWHRLDRVLACLRELPNTYFLVVGSGPALADLKVKAEQLGVQSQVEFTGLVDRADIPKYLATFDVALQPNIVAYASPLKVFEYLVMGLPTLAPRQPNIQELLEEEYNALFFNPCDQGEFEQQLKRLVTDSELRKTLSDNAANTLQQRRISWQENANKVIRLAEKHLD
jgi:glycosyltransferase involved in cell wall biosynthesis